jgi:hypothetical protein
VVDVKERLDVVFRRQRSGKDCKRNADYDKNKFSFHCPPFCCDNHDAGELFFIAEKIEKNPREKYLIIDTFSGLCRMAFERLSCINPPVSLPVVSSNRYGGLLADPVGIFPEKNFQEFAVWHKVQ